jgi:putative transcriptional regulator
MKNKLEELRKQNQLTQEQLAEKLQVSRQTIHSIESQKYLPSITLAFKIARLFNLSIEDIFDYNEEESS